MIDNNVFDSIKIGLASPEQMREYRGNFDTPGKDSPYRNRPIEESLSLFE